MNAKTDETEFDSLIRESLGTAPRPNFESWKSAHQADLALLGSESIVISNQVAHGGSRRRAASIVMGLAASFLVAIFLWPFADSSSTVYAQAIAGIDKVKQLTWTVTVYVRYTSKDGQRTWIQKEEIPHAYRSPGLVRETRLDGSGQVVRVSTTNAQTRQTLLVMPSEKKAVLKAADSSISSEAPFAYVGKIIREHKSEGEWLVRSVRLVGDAKMDDKNAKVVRAVLQSGVSQQRRRNDFYFDSQSRALLGVWEPNDPNDEFESFPDVNNPKEEEWSRMLPIGAMWHRIDAEPKLSDADFSLDPPSGYSVERLTAPTISEDDMLAYLRAVAEFQRGLLPETIDHSAIDRERLDAAYSAPETSRSPQANALVGLVDNFRMREIYEPPMKRFVNDQTEPKTFHYVGSGVKLGSEKEIVCWYRLKGASTYHVVYGDLQIRELKRGELPLIPQ